MRIPCPLCGLRDRREFYYYGSTDYLARAGEGADIGALEDQLFLRDNKAGDVQDLWYHEGGCGAWLRVSRNTVTHAVAGAELVMGPEGAAPAPAEPAAPAPVAAPAPAESAPAAFKSARKPKPKKEA